MTPQLKDIIDDIRTLATDQATEKVGMDDEEAFNATYDEELKNIIKTINEEFGK